jgi:hypothetical protein
MLEDVCKISGVKGVAIVHRRLDIFASPALAVGTAELMP